MFTRLKDLSSEVYDIVIVGGGINGATIAWEATLRGLKVALLEKGDFGSGSSAGNFKIVHGGLRYLQHLDLPRLYESAREQLIFRKIAPHLVHPFPFLVPCYGAGLKGKEFLSFGTKLYDLLTYWKNKGVSAQHRIPSPQTLSRGEVLQIAPGIDSTGLRGGVVFYDCQMSNPDRLTLSFILSAQRQGADLRNYATVSQFHFSPSARERTITRLTAHDSLTGDQFEVSGRYFINATGPWTDSVIALATGGEESKTPLFSKGLQVILPRVIDHYAVAVESRYRDKAATVRRGNRSYFIVPWLNVSMVGTADIAERTEAEGYRLTKAEVAEFIEEVAAAYQDPRISTANVKLAFGGLRPVDPVIATKFGEQLSSGSVEVARRDRIVEHYKQNGPSKIANLISVQGIKYTTARYLAEQIIDKAAPTTRKNRESRTTPLIGGGLEDLDQLQQSVEKDWGLGLDSYTAQRLVKHYGTSVKSLKLLLDSNPELIRPLSENCLAVELVHAAKFESVRNLSDIVFRRTSLGPAGHPGAEALERASQIVAQECGWPDPFRKSQLEEVSRSFELPER